VFDLPDIALRVSEHQLIKRRCACGVITTGDAPDGVAAPVQYGPRVAAIVIYLYAGQFLSKDRTATAMAELVGAAMLGGTVATLTGRAAGRLNEAGGFTGQVRDAIAGSRVAHFDETGMRVQGQLRWVHSASTGNVLITITVHDKRGVEAMNAAGGCRPSPGSPSTTGGHPTRLTRPRPHARCNAHLLRELQAVIDHHTATGGAGTWCWAVGVGNSKCPLSARRRIQLGAHEASTGVIRRNRVPMGCPVSVVT
jgi:transposase